MPEKVAYWDIQLSSFLGAATTHTPSFLGRSHHIPAFWVSSFLVLSAFRVQLCRTSDGLSHSTIYLATIPAFWAIQLSRSISVKPAFKAIPAFWIVQLSRSISVHKPAFREYFGYHTSFLGCPAFSHSFCGTQLSGNSSFLVKFVNFTFLVEIFFLVALDAWYALNVSET